jgi:hypothetical protein
MFFEVYGTDENKSRTSAQKKTKVAGFRWCGVWYLDRGCKMDMQRKKDITCVSQSKKNWKKIGYHGEREKRWYKPLWAEIYLLIVSQSMCRAAHGVECQPMSATWGLDRRGWGWVSFGMYRHIQYMQYYCTHAGLAPSRWLEISSGNVQREAGNWKASIDHVVHRQLALLDLRDVNGQACA